MTQYNTTQHKTQHNVNEIAKPPKPARKVASSLVGRHASIRNVCEWVFMDPAGSI
jgi:hypothetical protein